MRGSNTTVGKYFGLRPVVGAPLGPAPAVPEAFNITSQCLIGIEVEMEQCICEAEYAPAFWGRTIDGSLRNFGAEWVSRPFPANCAAGMLYELFNRCVKKQYSFTPRTSIHVHLNAQDMSGTQLQSFLAVYALFEDVLYSFVGRGRRRNIFCVPIMDTILPDAFNAHGLDVTWEKYTGLNLCPISQQGTVEFRHMHGTDDIRKLTTWIALITSLKEFTMSKGHQPVLDLLANRTPYTSDVGLGMDAANMVFGTALTAQLKPDFLRCVPHKAGEANRFFISKSVMENYRLKYLGNKAASKTNERG